MTDIPYEVTGTFINPGEAKYPLYPIDSRFGKTTVLDAAGHIYACGKNNNYNLGFGDTVERHHLERVSLGISGLTFIDVSSNEYCTMAVSSSQELYAVGDNRNGQFGGGLERRIYEQFVKVPLALGPITKVLCGQSWTFILAVNMVGDIPGTNNTLYVSGICNSDQLGVMGTPLNDTNNNFIDISSDPVTGAARMVADVYTGREHSIYITPGGTGIYFTGSNRYGQLGLKDPSARNLTFIQNELVPQVNSIRCGDYHTMYVRFSDNGGYCTGRNNFGQLGLGDNIDRYGFELCISSPISSFPHTTGNTTIFYVTNLGVPYNSGQEVMSLYVAGQNDKGQLGLGDTIDRNVFTKKEALSLSEFLLLAYTKDGTVFNNYGSKIEGYAFGDNEHGQLSLEGKVENVEIITENRTLYVGGENNHGQAGVNSLEDQTTLKQLSKDIKPKKVSNGGNYTIILDINGVLWASGNNSRGQLGLGDNVQRSKFEKVSDKIYIDIACSEYRAIAIDEHGYMYVSGVQLDNQSEEQVFTLHKTLDSISWKQVSSSNTHSLAIDSNNKLFGYGDNSNGQFGRGDSISSLTDFVLISNEDWIKIETANGFSSCIKSDKRLYSAGKNEVGQLGIGSYIDTNIFTEVQFFDSDEEINAFNDVSIYDDKLLAIRTDNKLFVSGKNGYIVHNTSFTSESHTILLNDTPNIVLLSMVWAPKLKFICGIFNNSVTGVLQVATSEDGKTWTVRYHLNQNGTFWGNSPKISWAEEISLFCIIPNTATISSTAGSVLTLTSSDGINWTLNGASVDYNYVAVCWSPELELFCAIGGNTHSLSGSGGVMLSSDGNSWNTYSVPNMNSSFCAICWSPKLRLFCAISTSSGSRNDDRVLTSPDGINWTKQIAIGGSSVRWKAVAWSPELELFCAVGDLTNNGAMTSPDGINWTLQSGLANNPWVSISWSSELHKFCTIANNSRYTFSAISSDGITWELSSQIFRENYVSIAWSPKLQDSDQGIFCAIGTNNDRALISYDGLTWTTGRLSGATTWSSITWCDAPLELFCAIATNGGVAISKNGTEWTGVWASIPYPWQGVCYSPQLNLLCAVTNYGINNRYMISSDAINWTSPIVPSYIAADLWEGFCWSPELMLFCAVGDNGYRALSVDGLNWDSGPIISADALTDVCWSSELRKFCAISGTRFFLSEDGISWSSIASPAGAWKRIIWSSEKQMFVTVSTIVGTSNTISGVIANSQDGVTWNIVPTGMNFAWKSICWSEELGIFVAVPNNNNNTFMTSADGKIWRKAPVSSQVGNHWESICWSPQLRLFLAISSTGSVNRIIISNDGITWTVPTLVNPFIVEYSWVSVCWSPELGLFCAVATGGSALYRIMTSPDGINWQAIESPNLNIIFTSICWSSELNLFCIVGNNAGSQQRILTSTDGINWIINNAPNENNLTSVCWSAELRLFVAVSNTGEDNRVITSEDGATWVPRTSANPNNWISVCWSPELRMFCAVAPTYLDSYSRIMTSIDGIDWVAHSDNGLGSISSVCWSKKLNMFCTTNSNINWGQSGVALYSNDGVIWKNTIYNLNTSWTKILWDRHINMFLIFNADTTYRGTLPYNILGSYDGNIWEPIFDDYTNPNLVFYNDAIEIPDTNIIFAAGSAAVAAPIYEDNYNSNANIIIHEDKSVAYGGAIGLGSATEIETVNSLSNPGNLFGVSVSAGIDGSYFISNERELYFSGLDILNNKQRERFEKPLSVKNLRTVYTKSDSVYISQEIDQYIPPTKPGINPPPTPIPPENPGIVYPTLPIPPIEPPIIGETYVEESDHENYIPIYIHDNTPDFLRRGVILNPINAEYLENLDFEKTLNFEVVLDAKAASMIDENKLLTCKGQIFEITAFSKQVTSDNLFLVNVESHHISYILADELYIKSTIPPPYWILNETVKEDADSDAKGEGFIGRVTWINSDNIPSISVFDGGINYTAGEILTIVGDQSELKFNLFISQTDQGRIITIREATEEDIRNRIPERPWTNGTYPQQWTSGDGIGLEIVIGIIARIRENTDPNEEHKINVSIRNSKNADKKPIKYYIRKRGDKFQLGDEVIVGDPETDELDPTDTHRRRLAKATVSKIRNKYVVNEDGSLTPKPVIISEKEDDEERLDPTEDSDGIPIIYAGPVESLSDFYTGAAIPETIDEPEYPDQNELVDDKTFNFFWTGTITEICKEILYHTKFDLVDTIPGFDGKLTFVSSAQNIKALLSDFISWLHDNWYSQSDIIFDNYYVRFIETNYEKYDFVYNSNKVLEVSYDIDKKELDPFLNYKIEYSFKPTVYDHNLKLTNNIRLLNEDLNIDQILRIRELRFNPYDLFDCNISISNLMKKRTILGSSIQTPEELKKQISRQLITDIKEEQDKYGDNEQNGMGGEDVGGVFDPGGTGDSGGSSSGEDGGEFPKFSPDEEGYHLVVDSSGTVIAEPFIHLVIEDHIPTVSETNAYRLDTVVFVYDPTKVIDPTPDPEPDPEA